MNLEVLFSRNIYRETRNNKQEWVPHIVPIWFTLDNEDNIIFNTGKNSVKGKNILRHNRVSLYVDDQVLTFSFVTIDGITEIISNKSIEIIMWAKIIAARYMGSDKAEEYDKRNSSEGELLLKIKSTKVIGQKDLAG
jgi:general stress protein 26